MRTQSLFVMACLAGVALASTAEAGKPHRVDYGRPVAVGEGTARAWVEKGPKGRMHALGIALSKDALRGLPSGAPEYEYTLELPYAVPPYQAITLNWNPGGHPPAPIYGVPHFDFHFYTIGEEVRHSMTCMGPDLEVCKRPPAPELIPTGYIPGDAVPMMGWHWVDPTSPEFNGRPFTSTFIYGFYDGQHAFVEPMITLAYLLSRPNAAFPVKQPEAFSYRGYYPQKYRVFYDPEHETYNVVLEQLVYR